MDVINLEVNENKSLEEYILNFQNLPLDEKFVICSNQLITFENNITKFENDMYKNWDLNSSYIMMDKYDYYDYMLQSEEYENLITIKNVYERYLDNLNNLSKSEESQ